MLTLIGLGLGTKEDITLKGMNAVKEADVVYLEYYTSILQDSKEELEQFYGKELKLAPRLTVEGDDNEILTNAKDKKVCLLVIGDPLCATTHMDLYMRAKELKIPCEIIHNASIVSAIGITGLQVYKFGKITSIPFENERVDTPYTVLKGNLSLGMHTLFLLDLRPDENQYLSVNKAIAYLLNKETEKKEELLSEDSLAIGLARVGAKDQLIKCGTLKELSSFDFGGPVHSLVIPGNLHFMEEDALELWK